MGTGSGIDLLNPSTGSPVSELPGHGEPNALDFNTSGTLLAATTDQGTTLWDMATRTALWSRSDKDDDHTAAFTSDGQSLVIGTAAGYSVVVDVTSGAVVRTVVPPDSQSVATGTPDPVAIDGTILLVGTDTNGPTDVSGELDLWDTQGWNLVNVVASVTGDSITSVAISKDGTYIAAGLADGTGGVWTQSGNDELFSLEGQGAQINTLSFSPDGTRLVDADDQGDARIYRSGEPWLTTLPQVPHWCDFGFGSQPHKLLGLTQTGVAITLQTWALPSFRPTSSTTVLASGEHGECSALSPDARLVALWNALDPTSTVRVFDVATRRVELTLPAMAVQGASFSDDDRLLGRHQRHRPTRGRRRVDPPHGACRRVAEGVPVERGRRPRDQ